jgi:hypothetical protein
MEKSSQTGVRITMNKTGRFAIGCISLLAMIGLVPTQAAEQNFDVGASKIKLNLPKDWQAAHDVFGLPLVIMSPEVSDGGRRAVISVVPTGLTGVKMDPKNLGADQKSYQKARKEWLSQYEGKALEFFPYKNTKWGNSDVHTIGYKYEINGEQLVENSYYVVCNDQLYHFKSMTTTAQDSAFKGAIDDSLRSFQCN